MISRSVTVLVAALGLLPALAAAESGLSASDIAKIRRVHQRYEEGWRKGDADAVRSLFTEDCVLLPHHGDPPRVGKKEMNAFWFPPNSPPTTVTKLVLTLTSIGGDGQIAHVWGTDEVAWTTVQDGKSVAASNRGTFLNILKKQPNGEWKISHHMWDDPVSQQ